MERVLWLNGLKRKKHEGGIIIPDTATDKTRKEKWLLSEKAKY
jgi:co-chaperonin GroES (HSP10)